MRGITRVLQDFKAKELPGSQWEVPGQGRAWLVGESLVFLSDSNAFRAVGAVDLAALMFRGSEGLQGRAVYERAVRYILDTEGMTWETQDPEAMDRQIDEFIARRAIFDLCVHVSFRRYVSDWNSFLRSKGVEPRVDPLTLVPFSAGMMDNLVKALTKLDLELPPGIPKDREILVCPLYKDPSTVGALQFILRDSTLTLPLQTAPVLYTGIPCVRPSPYLYLRSDPFEASRSNRILHDASRQGTVSQAMVYPAPPGVQPWVYPGVTRILVGALETEWAASVGGILDSRASVRVLGDSNLLIHDSGLSVREFVGHHLMLRTSDDQFGPLARQLMDAYGSPVGFKGVMETRLREAGRHQAVKQLSELYADGLLVKQGNTEIHVSSSGYILFDREKGERTPLTNFTLELLRQVVFPEHPGTYLEVNAGDRRLTIPESCFDSGKKLGQYLQGSCNEQGAPRVIEPAKLGLVLRKLREQTSGLAMVNGVSFLGWNGLKNRWYSPGYQVTASGCVEDPSIPWLPHPETQHFKAGLVEPVLNPDLPVKLCGLVGQILALVHRRFSGYPVRAVGILNTAHNREIVSRVFRGMGQERIIQLSTNARSKSVLESLRGYPCLVQGGKAEKLEEGLFCLGENGLGFVGVTEEEADAAAGTLSWMVRELVAKLVTGEDLLGRPSCRVLFEEALSADGAKIARTLGGLIEWPQEDTEFPAVERLLNGVAPVDVHKYWQFDLFEQQVYLNTRDLPRGLLGDVEGLVRELGVFVKDIRAKDGYLSMDAGDAQRMLRNYHGEPVELQSVNLEAAMNGLHVVSS